MKIFEVTKAEYQVPSHELDDKTRQATAMAQKIRRKINSGEQMDDMDYNQLAELGAVLSRFGVRFGPRTMKDVFNHMIQYTNDRNAEGNKYPEFTLDRFKQLVSMAR
jgi:Zn-dependent oligopeptidase